MKMNIIYLQVVMHIIIIIAQSSMYQYNGYQNTLKFATYI